MCGIAGFTWDDKNLIKRMLQNLTHRGPDAEGFYLDNNISLGHRRLSIIDLSENGKQPLCNENKDVWVTFNGEIYNYKTLRVILESKGHKFSSDTDTEVLVHAYEEFGIDFISHLRGEYAFALYDSIKKKVLIVRDRMGVKPLYYTLTKKGIMFSSELQAILKSGVHQFTFDEQSLQTFMQERCVFGTNTIITQIKRVKPGEVLSVDVTKKTFETKTYWESKPEPKGMTFNEFSKKLKELTTEAVNDRLQADVPVGAYLSGGIDSSIIVSLASKSYQNLKTFSISFENNDKLSEQKFAEEVSSRFNTQHFHFSIDKEFMKDFPKIIRSCDEPLADTAIIPTYYLAQKASKKNVKVVLTGDGADELFGGYEQYKVIKFAPILRPIIHLARPIIAITPLSLFGVISPFIPKMGREAIESLLTGMSIKKPDEQYLAITSLFKPNELNAILKKTTDVNPFSSYFLNGDPVNGAMYAEQKTILPEDYLMKVDKMTMAHSIEPRVAYLDHRIVELSNAMPSKFKLTLQQDKKILKETFKDIVPASVRTRKKQRFYVPIEIWLQQNKQLPEEINASPVIKKYFKNLEVGKILENINKLNLYNARQIWALHSLQMWYAEYRDLIV